jgi:hypothetical protein
MKTKEYSTQQHKIRALKQTNLKEMYIVRYADDFKILTNNYISAQKIFIAVIKWLKERLKLDISAEKSMVISMILGWHNYYKIATQVNLDFSEINFLVRKRLYNRTRSIRSDTLYENKTYKRIYGKYNFKPISICKITIYPLAGVKFKIPRLMMMIANRYTILGRFHIHKDLSGKFKDSLKFLINNPLKNESIQKNDNRLSLFVAQRGLCHVSKENLDINDMEIRNIVPKENGGTDRYHNLVLVNRGISSFINETDELKINEYKERIKLDRKALNKINKLRKLVGNSMI